MSSSLASFASLLRPEPTSAGSFGDLRTGSCGTQSCLQGRRMPRGMETPSISTARQGAVRPSSPLTARASPRAPSPSPASHFLPRFPSLPPRDSPLTPSSPARARFPSLSPRESAFPPSSPVSTRGQPRDSSPLPFSPSSHRLLSREPSPPLSSSFRDMASLTPSASLSSACSALIPSSSSSDLDPSASSLSSETTRASASTNGVAGVEAGVYEEQRQGWVASLRRETKETSVHLSIDLDGTGLCSSSTGIPFLDHMMDQLSSHGLFDITIKAEGDYHIDDHHTNEDVGLALGTALAEALGDRKGIRRFGDFSAPLDEALIHVVLDLSGRPHLSYDLVIPTERVGTYDTQLVEHFFQSLVNTSGMTLHIRQLAGKNSHHIIEATFKAFARALRAATEADPRRAGIVPSSKGVLSQQ